MIEPKERALLNRITTERIIADGLREEIRQYVLEVDRLRAELNTLKLSISKLSQELEKNV